MTIRKLACAIFAIATMQSAGAQDIAGVSLGSSLVAGKTAMLKANNTLQVSPLTRRNGSSAGLTAVSSVKTPGGPADEFALLNDAKGNIFFVGRLQRYAQGSRVPEKTLVETLTKKFGKPSNTVTVLSTIIKWQWDRNGKLYSGPSDSGPCDKVGFGHTYIPGLGFPGPENFSANCGKMVQAMYRTVSDDLLDSFTLMVLDGKTIYDELNAKEVKAEADRKQKIELEKSKGTVPQI